MGALGPAPPFAWCRHCSSSRIATASAGPGGTAARRYGDGIARPVRSNVLDDEVEHLIGLVHDRASYALPVIGSATLPSPGSLDPLREQGVRVRVSPITFVYEPTNNPDRGLN